MVRTPLNRSGQHQADTATVQSLPENDGHADRAWRYRDLTEWEHMNFDKVDGTATLRLVKSTAPKGLYFGEDKIRSENRGETAAGEMQAP